MKSPKLRTVSKSRPAFPLNEFPKNFAFSLGKELIYLLSSKGSPVLEGSEWEHMFATCIGAEWKPSNVGLDDVILGNTAWGAKTVKSPDPFKSKKVRLISGRNSPFYSFDEPINPQSNPVKIGKFILDIWNERVSAIREKYKNLRTVVLIKSADLLDLVVFEFETVRYDHDLFEWQWNENNNLIGIGKKTGEKKFTWQPHGSQFTIIEEVPKKSIFINIKQPPVLVKDDVFKIIGFDESWIKITKKSD